MISGREISCKLLIVFLIIWFAFFGWFFGYRGIMVNRFTSQIAEEGTPYGGILGGFPQWVNVVGFLLAVASIIVLVFLLWWKRWAYYGYFITSLAIIIWNIVVGTSLIFFHFLGLITLLASIIGPLFIYYNFKKRQQSSVNTNL
jgi:hypothetical protein